MSREEMLAVLKGYRDNPLVNAKEAFDMAIEALEQEPCTDMVSRDAMWDVLQRLHGTEGELVDELMSLPPVLPMPKMGKWIPVETALPEVGSEVLVCYEFKKHRSVYIADFYGDGKFHGLDDEYLTTEGRKYRKAVAWMPLPTPPNQSEIPTGQIVANGELYPGEFDDPLAEEGSDKE